MFGGRLKIDNTKVISFFYFFLLVYTIAALVWWGILLHRQNKEIVALKKTAIAIKEKAHPADTSYEEMFQQIEQEKHLRNLQYLGEGGAFLLIILLSAGFVYQAMRRQIRFTRQQQNFMMAVTHELKSPIAVVRLNIETLLKRKLPDDKQTQLLSKMLAETNRLNRLSNNMLLASRFENEQYQIIKEPLNFSDVVKKLIEENKNRMPKNEIKSKIDSDVSVEGDKLMLQIACSNLIENAQKYAPAKSKIVVLLKEKEHHAVFQCIDEGEGIPEREKSKIFNRFYRIGNEDTRRTQGTGLGLFLTRKIILQHQGQIIVKDNTPKGSIFEVLLPLKKS